MPKVHLGGQPFFPLVLIFWDMCRHSLEHISHFRSLRAWYQLWSANSRPCQNILLEGKKNIYPFSGDGQYQQAESTSPAGLSPEPRSSFTQQHHAIISTGGRLQY